MPTKRKSGSRRKSCKTGRKSADGVCHRPGTKAFRATSPARKCSSPRGCRRRRSPRK